MQSLRDLGLLYQSLQSARGKQSLAELGRPQLDDWTDPQSRWDMRRYPRERLPENQPAEIITPETLMDLMHPEMMAGWQNHRFTKLPIKTPSYGPQELSEMLGRLKTERGL